MGSRLRRTSLSTLAASIGDHPCFATCSRKSLEQLRRSGSCVAIAPGAVLQRRQPTRWVYFLLSGTLSIDACTDAWLVGPGETVGLHAAFGDVAPTLTVEAATTTVVYVIGTQELRAVATANPSILEGIAIYLARHPN